MRARLPAPGVAGAGVPPPAGTGSGLRFWKMCAAGNDFVLVERRPAARTGIGPAALAARLCDRRRGIGADGLLVVDAARPLPFVSYRNSDGSTAFCGNGTRAAAVWLYRRGFTNKASAFSFRTSAGRMSARVSPDTGTASIRMPDPKGLRLGLKLSLPGGTMKAHFVDTGVPHAVVPVKGLGRLDVVGLGQAIRNHPAFKPCGANADFISYGRPGIVMRTYERGVEDETLACGTGAVAAAVVAHALGRAKPPVKVSVRGGVVLKVDFRQAGSSAADVWLEGPAAIVFTGEFFP
ncbi:MAG: diaminopimelate epimerase [Elusimicrobia bacterium]|nr:diaminopimelate epimerase [Elusimicrobiota bacterium]